MKYLKQNTKYGVSLSYEASIIQFMAGFKICRRYTIKGQLFSG